MADAHCPHCNAVNPSDAQFCEACGKAVPIASSSEPRILGTDDLATTQAGRELQATELRKQAKKAAGALLTVAILQAIFGTFIIFLAANANKEEGVQPVLFVVLYGIALLFFGLFLWARHNPFPAAIVGLIVFVSLHLLDAIADPTALARGIVVKVIIIAVLIRAIKAGSTYRVLSRQM